MTFTNIVAEVMDRLNLTTTTAQTRIGKAVNDRYRRLTSAIGLQTSRQEEISTMATIGDRTMRFNGVEKILSVVDRSGPQDILLNQLTKDEMHVTLVRTEPPRNYAITNIHANSVDIYVDCVPTTAFTLWADAQVSVTTLSGDLEPDFPESFHDILVFGAMADEYRKMEKLPLMQDAESNYEHRLSDLRMWIAKSAYLDITPGRYNSRYFRWTRNAKIAWGQ